MNIESYCRLEAEAEMIVFRQEEQRYAEGAQTLVGSLSLYVTGSQSESSYALCYSTEHA